MQALQRLQGHLLWFSQLIGKTKESLFKSFVPHAYIISQNSYLDLLDFDITLYLNSRHVYHIYKWY